MKLPFRTISIALVGQSIVERMHEAKEGLEDLYLQNHEEFSQEDQLAFKLISKQLSEEESLKSLDYFVMNKTTLLSIFSTVVTYCIILMQFKQVGF